MQSISVFLASSNELETDRKAFESLIFQKTKIWTESREMFIELRNWEDFIDAMSKTRLQNEYNNAIRTSDIFVMLFWTKVGKYTHEEFDVAWKQFQDTGQPLLYTYFKTAPSDKPVDPSLQAFRTQLAGLGHFPTEYKNTEGLLLHFTTQLDKLYETKRPGKLATVGGLKTKEEIITMISKGQLVDTFEELQKHFQFKNFSLNGLMNEYINQSSNYNEVSLSMRLRALISRDL